ncbi:uncharacterized protein LOC122821052 isoform X3 [Gambusia affinis]|uniref:uncharacterized protein LOC122821052 isoform X3 n=1 Tax=Gambusia affinis TaxID=33528 RepID=UPI001CDC98CB|nr:uncharacterized protein LOC122821052 isoform X3 [Gambusia affinis]
MAFSSLCLMLSLCSAAKLTVTPDQSQFFQYDSITLTCVTNSSGWKVMRKIKNKVAQECERSWGIPTESACNVKYALAADIGEYWCESERGETSNKINLTVSARADVSPPPSFPLPPSEPGVPWTRVICGIALFILYNIILILCIYTYRKWARAKTDMKRRTADHVLVN